MYPSNRDSNRVVDFNQRLQLLADAVAGTHGFKLYPPIEEVVQWTKEIYHTYCWSDNMTWHNDDPNKCQCFPIMEVLTQSEDNSVWAVIIKHQMMQ